MSDPAHEDENVGSLVLEYVCSLPSEYGMVRNLRVLFFKVGDDPNWWLAQRLMPGAVPGGRVGGVFTIGDPDEEGPPVWECELRVRGSAFRTYIPAQSLDEVLTICRDVGGIQVTGHPQVSFWGRVRLFLRYYWLRRPKVVRSSPLDP